MSEQENKKASAQKEIECPICGAHVSARRIYCPECGGVIRPDRVRKKEVEPSADKEAAKPEKNNSVGASAAAETPSEQKPSETDAPKTVAANAETIEVENGKERESENALPPVGARLCRKCGKPVEFDSKFCKHCGAVCINESGSFCCNCGTRNEYGVNFCKSCGAPIAGAAVGGGTVMNVAAPVPLSPEEVAEIADKKRKRSATTIATVVLALQIIMFVFCSACEFMTVRFYTSDGTMELSQDFITMIMIAFGGQSALTMVGVPLDILKFAGWLYLSDILVLAVAVACIIINLARNKSTRPVGVAFVTIAQLVIATAIFALGLVAKSNIDYDVLPDTYVSALMNGVGLFICGILGLIMGGGSCFITWVAYRGADKKRSRAKIAAWAMEGFAVLAACAFVFAPVFSATAADTISPNGSGKLTVCLTECVGDGCYGGAVIKLDGLEYGEEYEFSLRTNGIFGEDFTEESLILFPADQVVGGSIAEAAFFGDILEINQSYGPNSAKLMFTADYSGELAVVIMFAYYVPLTVGVEYSLDLANG